MAHKITCKLPRYIYATNTPKGVSFYIKKWVIDKQVYFGSFKTLKEAKDRVQYLSKNGWKESDKTRLRKIEGKYGDYISYNKRAKKYSIKKNIGGTVKFFGYYDTYKEAEEKVKHLRDKRWVDEERERAKRLNPPYKYIKKVKTGEGIRYCIVKSSDNYWGSYDDLKTALNDRDFFEESGWDEEVIVNEYDLDRPNRYDDVELPPLPDRLK